MAKVENPFGPGEVSTSNPAGSAKSIVFGVAGMALFFAMLAYGQAGGSWITGMVDRVTGANASGNSIGFRGDL